MGGSWAVSNWNLPADSWDSPITQLALANLYFYNFPKNYYVKDETPVKRELCCAWASGHRKDVHQGYSYMGQCLGAQKSKICQKYLSDSVPENSVGNSTNSTRRILQNSTWGIPQNSTQEIWRKFYKILTKWSPIQVCVENTERESDRERTRKMVASI